MKVGRISDSAMPGEDDLDREAKAKRDAARLKAIHQLVSDLDDHEVHEFDATANNHGNDDAEEESTEQDISIPEGIDPEELKRRIKTGAFKGG